MKITNKMEITLQDRVLEFLEKEPETGFIFDEVKINQYKERPQYINLEFTLTELKFEIYITPNEDNKLCFVWHSEVNEFKTDGILLTWENIYARALDELSRDTYELTPITDT